VVINLTCFVVVVVVEIGVSEGCKKAKLELISDNF